MKTEELKRLLTEIRILPAETEWVEFKAARSNFHFNDIGKYFSALCNEANLKGKSFGWLVFGIDDKTRAIVGTQYRPKRSHLDSLKQEIANKTTNRITFIEIYELSFPEGRVILFQIPAAPQGIPIGWEGHYYGRDGESLAPLNIQEIEQIRGQAKKDDWSSYECEGAGVSDLETEAILKARNEYKKKNPKLAPEVDNWDDITFLNKAQVAIRGKITRTAIILLGKLESAHFLSPFIAKVSWILKDEHNNEKDYEHFGPPFILHTDAILAKIRNLKYRYLPDNTLFPMEINQYDSYVIREALHNCIAHQDYELEARITVVERPDEIIFSNAGSFIPQSVEMVIEQDAPQKYYRNQYLANAMVAFNMIDTVGGGIKKMFNVQRDRFFPLPTYEISVPNEVTVRILGKTIDENYTRLLINNTQLDLKTVIALDKVQKKIRLLKEEHALLKKQNLIEGRYPNVFVVSKIAKLTGDKATYIKNRPFDKEYYKTMILNYLKEYGFANRKDIDALLLSKLSDILSGEQKYDKIGNLLYEMAKKDKSIVNSGSDRKPKWVLK